MEGRHYAVANISADKISFSQARAIQFKLTPFLGRGKVALEPS